MRFNGRMTTTPPPVPPNVPPGGPYSVPQPLSPSDERLWSTLIHIGGIFFSFVPALVGYLVLKDRGPFVRAHSTTALNFQLTVLIASFAAGIVSGILFATFIFAPVGFLLILAVGVYLVVFSVIAAIAANKGEFYRYPLSIEFLK